MGSRCSIVIEAETEREAAQAASLGFDEIARIEQVLSDYRSDSESMLLMEGDPGTWYPVSECLFEVLAMARDIHNRTHGAFDPTIGAYTHLWRGPSMPEAHALSAARSRVGMGYIELDSEARAVRFSTPGMILDFGGVGKGYAAQRARSEER
ncbi:MAG: FAD:protein FMN transferase, partial [Phycisphaerales bacterium]